LTRSAVEGCKQRAFHTRDRIGIEVAPNDFEARHGAGQRRHRRRGFVAGTARWLTLLQTSRGRAGPITASVRAVELGVSERMPYRDIAELTAQGAPINGVVIDVLRVIGRRTKTGSQFRTSIDGVGRSGYRRVASSRDVAGRNLDLWGMLVDVLKTLPGYGMPFCPTFPDFRDQRAPLSIAASSPGDGCHRKPKR
jgi:hypothetical protein